MPGGIASRGFGVGFWGEALLGWASGLAGQGIIQCLFNLFNGRLLLVLGCFGSSAFGWVRWAWVWAIILCDSGTFLVFLDFLRSWVFFSSAGKAQSAARMPCFAPFVTP